MEIKNIFIEFRKIAGNVSMDTQVFKVKLQNLFLNTYSFPGSLMQSFLF